MAQNNDIRTSSRLKKAFIGAALLPALLMTARGAFAEPGNDAGNEDGREKIAKTISGFLFRGTPRTPRLPMLGGWVEKTEQINDGTIEGAATDDALNNALAIAGTQEPYVTACFSENAKEKKSCLLPPEVVAHIERIHDLPPDDQIFLTQKFVNEYMTYELDDSADMRKLRGLSDLPDEMAIEGRARYDFHDTLLEVAKYRKGDCTNYALMKFYLLTYAGFPQESLMLVTGYSVDDRYGSMDEKTLADMMERGYSHATRSKIYTGHMTLTARSGEGQVLVLDVQPREKAEDIYAGNDYGDTFIPMYGRNADASFVFHGDRQRMVRSNLMRTQDAGEDATPPEPEPNP